MKDEDKNVLSFLDFIDSIKNEKEEERNSDRSDKETNDIDLEEIVEEKYNNGTEDMEEEKMNIEEEKVINLPTGRRKPAKKRAGVGNNHQDESLEARRQDLAKFESIEKKQKVSDLNWKKGQTQHIRIRSIFKLVYDFLSKSIFNPKWEIRHGACIALRNFIKKDIHKLYINLTLARTEIMAMDDQEESLTNFIRNTVRNLTISNAFFEDFLSRQLVIIALDRFMDHSSDRVSFLKDLNK